MIRLSTRADKLRAAIFIAVLILALFLMAPRSHGSAQNDAPKQSTGEACRLWYKGREGDSALKNWYTDYPAMDRNLERFVGRLTNAKFRIGLVKPSDKRIYACPLLYVVEPEQVTLTSIEETTLREWLARGGFLILDDFHGTEELTKTVEWLRRVAPDRVLERLTVDHPLFHVHFDIREIVQAVNDSVLFMWRNNQGDLWENGETGREPMVFLWGDNVLLSWNNDLGDGLEWADDEDYPLAMKAYAARFMVNAVIWGMTHG